MATITLKSNFYSKILPFNVIGMLMNDRRMVVRLTYSTQHQPATLRH